NEDSNKHQLLSENAGNANSLFSITDHEQQGLTSTILDQISRVGSDSIRTSVTQLIQQTLSLNHKQFLIARIILNHAIQHHEEMTVDAQNQMLLYINSKS